MVRAERIGAAAVVTIDRPERRNAVDGATATALRAAFDAFAADDGARVLVLTGAGEAAFCAGPRPHRPRDAGRRRARRTARLHAPGLAQAGDRRRERVVRGRRARARALVRSADRRRGRALRLPGAALGRAADRRRDAAAAARRRARPGARPDPQRPRRGRRRGAGHGAGVSSRPGASCSGRSSSPRRSPASRRTRCCPTARRRWPRRASRWPRGSGSRPGSAPRAWPPRWKVRAASDPASRVAP